MEDTPGYLFGNASERHEASTSVDDIVQVYERWSRRPAGDPRIKVISAVLADALKDDTALRGAADFMVDFHERPGSFRGGIDSPGPYRSSSVRPFPFPEYGANLLLRGLWHEWRHMGDEIGWPEQFLSREVCEKWVHFVAHQPEILDRFTENIAFRPVQTTVPDRIIGAKLGLEAYRGRFTDETGAPRPINMVSFGHGGGLGERKLMRNLPFKDIRLHDFADFSNPYLSYEAENSLKLNQRLNRPLPVGRIICMDIMPGDTDPAIRDWIMSSFTPSEQMNRSFMAEVEELGSRMPDGYVSLRGDVTTTDGVESLKAELGEEKADFVFLSTTMYQRPEAERQTMLMHAAEILAPGGLIGVQDHLEVRNIIDEKNSAVTQRLNFPGNWKSWMYQLVLIDDPKNNGWNFETKIYYKDGRAHDLYIPHRFRRQILGSAA
jgi:hypothetical protein